MKGESPAPGVESAEPDSRWAVRGLLEGAHFLLCLYYFRVKPEIYAEGCDYGKRYQSKRYPVTEAAAAMKGKEKQDRPGALNSSAAVLMLFYQVAGELCRKKPLYQPGYV